MAKIIPFPAPRSDATGIVHVWPVTPTRDAEIGHESASGNSWGAFDHFATTQEAIAAAHILNRTQYGGACEVCVHPLPAADDDGEAA